jgi:hypothetical protein
VDNLVVALGRYHRRIGSRWRAHELMTQAVLTLAYLEGGHTYRSLAEGNGVPKSTCHTYVQEGIKVLARRALPLTEVVRLAVKAGWDYLIVDGVNIPTERVAAAFTRKQHWYSGKHHRHGAAVQTVAAPDGELLWVSGVLPGKTVDITAARRFGIAEKVLAFLGLLADLGYIGLHPDAIVGYKRTRRERPSRRVRRPPTSPWPGCGRSANAPTPNSNNGKCWPTTSGATHGVSPRSSRRCRPCSTSSATRSDRPDP